MINKRQAAAGSLLDEKSGRIDDEEGKRERAKVSLGSWLNEQIEKQCIRVFDERHNFCVWIPPFFFFFFFHLLSAAIALTGWLIVRYNRWGFVEKFFMIFVPSWCTVSILFFLFFFFARVRRLNQFSSPGVIISGNIKIVVDYSNGRSRAAVSPFSFFFYARVKELAGFLLCKLCIQRVNKTVWKPQEWNKRFSRVRYWDGFDNAFISSGSKGT